MTTVVIIADSDPRKANVGGVGTYARSLTEYLITHGYQVIFLGKAQPGDIQRYYDKFRFVSMTDGPGVSNVAFLRGLWWRGRRLELDDDAIIHAQRPDWLVPFIKKKNRKVVTLHGSHAKSVRLKKGRVWSTLYGVLERKGLHAADAIISVSHVTQDEYVHQYPDIQDRIAVIPIGISPSQKTDRSVMHRLGIDTSVPVVLYAGRLSAEKQVTCIIDAMAHIDATLIIAGDGEERQALHEYADKSDVDIRFIGAVDHSDLLDLMRHCSCLCLASRYEGLPTVVLESLEAGLPVVSCPVGDVQFVVEEGRTGFIREPSTLSDGIQKAIKASKQMSKRCRSSARAYHWDLIGKRIEGVYYG